MYHPQNLGSCSIDLLVLVAQIGNQCRVEPAPPHPKTLCLFILHKQQQQQQQHEINICPQDRGFLITQTAKAMALSNILE